MSYNHNINRDIAKSDDRDNWAKEYNTFNGFTFDDSQNLQYDGRLECKTITGQNQIFFRNESNIYTPLNASFQRFYEQFASVIAVPSGVGVQTNLIDTTNALGGVVLPPNNLRRGSIYKVVASGNIDTANTNKKIKFRFFQGAILVSETPEILLPNLQAGSTWRLDLELFNIQIGPAGTASISSSGVFDFIDSPTGNVTRISFSGSNNTTYDTTIQSTARITAEWIDQNPGLTMDVQRQRFEVLV